MSAQIQPLYIYPKSLPAYSDALASKQFMESDLARSGLQPSDMNAYPVAPLFIGGGGYCIPYFDGMGTLTGMYRIRYDREDDKYIGPKGMTGIWLPREPQSALGVIYLVEGEKKAAAYKKRFPDRFVMGLGGCTGYATKDGYLAPQLLEVLTPDSKVIAIFDADIETNLQVSHAAKRLETLLQHQRCELQICYPPQGKGVDDWLVQDPQGVANLRIIELPGLSSFSVKLGQALGCIYKDDKLVLNELNAKLILQALWQGKLVRDHRLGLLLEGVPVQISDLDNRALEFMQRYVSAHYRPASVARGLQMSICTKTDYLQDLVRALKWDGIPRLESWGRSHFTTDLPTLADEWGRILMTGLGLRLLRPGTKVDLVCMLTGPQGIGKSTFFENLSTFEDRPYYAACTHMNTSEGDAKRTQGMTWAQSVVVDLAEGVVFRNRKSDQDLIKQEVSQVEDQFRLPYDRDIQTIPRGFIFVGTANRTDLFSDLTGSRRWLMLPVTKIAPLNYETKLQILAEIVVREEELRAAQWWDLRIKLEDLPESLRAEHSTVTDVRELLNTKFSKTDTFAEDLLALIESGGLPTIKGTKSFFLTSHFIAYHFEGQASHSNKTLHATLINGLAQSPVFPYAIEKRRVSPNQLVRPATVKPITSDWLSNVVKVPNAPQSQGWWITPK